MKDVNLRGLWLALTAIAVIGLAGCAAFAKPQSLDQRIAAAYTTHTAVVEAAATSVALGDIGSEQGQSILDLALRTRTILDSARIALGAGDIETAEGQVQLAMAILTELQAHLRRASQ